MTVSATSAPNSSTGRSVDKLLEEAELSGALVLAGRKLKDFPTQIAAKHDLSDTVSAGKRIWRFSVCCVGRPIILGTTYFRSVCVCARKKNVTLPNS